MEDYNKHLLNTLPFVLVAHGFHIQTDFGSMPSSRLEKMCKDRNLNITGKRQNEWRAMLEADEEQRMKCLLAIENDSIL